MKNNKFLALVVLFSVIALASDASAFFPQKGGKGRGGNGGGGHNHGNHNHGNHNHGNQNRGNGGRNFLSISPGGISYGYQNRNFGIAIGGIGGGINLGPANFGGSSANYGSFYQQPQPFYAQPTFGYATPVQNYSPIYPNSNNAVYPPQTINQPVVSNNQSVPTPGSLRTSALTIPTNAAASKYTKGAEEAFKLRNYAEARRLLEHSILEDKSNGHLRLFGSHISMALQDYEGAASELNTATKLLHPNDWDYFVRNIPFWYTNNEYKKQMDTLNQSIANNPSADSLALRGFQFACDGQVANAITDLNNAAKLAPESQLIKRLLSGLQTEAAPVEQERPTSSDSPLIGQPVEILPPPKVDSAAKSVIIRNN